jgi:hypothetical protein
VPGRSWSPHEEVFKGNAPLGSGEQGIALQAANFALLSVKRFNRDDLIFRRASWAGEGDRFWYAHCPKSKSAVGNGTEGSALRAMTMLC